MSRVDGRAPGRPSTRAGVTREEPAAPAARRSLWAVTVPLALLVLGIVLAVLLLPGAGDEGSGAGAGTDDELAAETQRMEEEFAERDRAQVQAVTATARRVAEDLGALLVEAQGSLPADLVGGGGGSLATPDQVTQWQQRTSSLVDQLGEPESASTQVNLARGALVAAVDAVALGVDSYDDALALAGADRASALARAATAFDLGRRTWAVAATGVDDANIQAGFGHQHVTLAGDTPPDSLPDGTDAE
ncbi:hypothetical protein [Nocardioides nanhaiensis]|uniref:DUF4439 domain-containing protein n=1 Tax=Nocardioides nanhaiensis TaxID=1476871 RepID=A0ABP8WCD9_9ACTN